MVKKYDLIELTEIELKENYGGMINTVDPGWVNPFALIQGFLAGWYRSTR